VGTVRHLKGYYSSLPPPSLPPPPDDAPDGAVDPCELIFLFSEKYHRRACQALAPAVPTLCSILLSANFNAREEALGALFALCPHNRTIPPNPRICPDPIRPLCSSSDPPSAQIYPEIMRQVNAGPFVDAMNSGSANAAYYACGIVYYLSKDSGILSSRASTRRVSASCSCT
jgi:hypothetical protein